MEKYIVYKKKIHGMSISSVKVKESLHNKTPKIYGLHIMAS